MIDDLWHVHVHIMTLQRRYYRIYGKNISAYTMINHITKLKQRTKPHWKQLPSQVVQDVALRMGKAYDVFFRTIKEREVGKTTRKAGLPKIKPRHKYSSITFAQAGYKLERYRIKINCIDTWFTLHKHREMQGTIKTVTIKCDRCGDYWVCFSCDDVDDSEPTPKTGKSAGFDFGVKTFLTCSDGTKIDSPHFMKQSLNKLRSLHKSLSRKTRKSNGWFKALRALCRQYRKITRQRLDWHWKLATRLCREYDILCFETLNIDGMKRLWGRKVSYLSFYQFLQIIELKCAKHNREFHKIGQWTATTKPCSDCGYHNKNLSLNDRQWTCPDCGSDHDREINAAINIRQAGLDVCGWSDNKTLALFETVQSL